MLPKHCRENYAELDRLFKLLSSFKNNTRLFFAGEIPISMPCPTTCITFNPLFAEFIGFSDKGIENARKTAILQVANTEKYTNSIRSLELLQTNMNGYIFSPFTTTKVHDYSVLLYILQRITKYYLNPLELSNWNKIFNEQKYLRKNTNVMNVLTKIVRNGNKITTTAEVTSTTINHDTRLVNDHEILMYLLCTRMVSFTGSNVDPYSFSIINRDAASVYLRMRLNEMGNDFTLKTSFHKSIKPLVEHHDISVLCLDIQDRLRGYYVKDFKELFTAIIETDLLFYSEAVYLDFTLPPNDKNLKTNTADLVVKLRNGDILHFELLVLPPGTVTYMVPSLVDFGWTYKDGYSVPRNSLSKLEHLQHLIVCKTMESPIAELESLIQNTRKKNQLLTEMHPNAQVTSFCIMYVAFAFQIIHRTI